jgi:hypothetical protein
MRRLEHLTFAQSILVEAVEAAAASSRTPPLPAAHPRKTVVPFSHSHPGSYRMVLQVEEDSPREDNLESAMGSFQAGEDNSAGMDPQEDSPLEAEEVGPRHHLCVHSISRLRHRRWQR